MALIVSSGRSGVFACCGGPNQPLEYLTLLHAACVDGLRIGIEGVGEIIPVREINPPQPSHSSPSKAGRAYQRAALSALMPGTQRRSSAAALMAEAST